MDGRLLANEIQALVASGKPNKAWDAIRSACRSGTRFDSGSLYEILRAILQFPEQNRRLCFQFFHDWSQSAGLPLDSLAYELILDFTLESHNLSKIRELHSQALSKHIPLSKSYYDKLAKALFPRTRDWHVDSFETPCAVKNSNDESCPSPPAPPVRETTVWTWPWGRFLSYCENGKVDQALNIWNQVLGKNKPKKDDSLIPSAREISSLQYACAHHKRVNQGVKALELLAEQEIYPFASAWKPALQALKHQGLFLEAAGLLARMQELGVRPDPVCFEKLLDGVLSGGQFRLAWELFEDFVFKGFPVPVDYALKIAFSLLNAGLISEAWAFWNQLDQRLDLQANRGLSSEIDLREDTRWLAMGLKAWLHQNQSGSQVKLFAIGEHNQLDARAFLEQRLEHSDNPPEPTQDLNTVGFTLDDLVEHLTRWECPDAALAVWGLAKDWRSDFRPSSRHAVAASFASNARMAETSKVLRQMEQDHFVWNPESVLAIAKSLCRAKRPDEARVFLEFIEQVGLPKNGIPLGVYETLIKAYGASNRSEQARSVLSDMARRGHGPDRIIFHALISAYSNNRRPDEAKSVLHEMEKRGIEPSIETYRLLIKAYGCSYRPDDAKALVAEMERRGIPPDGSVYNALIKMFGINKRPDEAKALVAEMEARGLDANAAIYGSLASALAKNSRVQESKDALQVVKNKGQRLDPSIYNRIINSLVYADRPEDARKVMVEMELESGAPHASTYGALIRAFSESHRFEDAKATLAKMSEAGVSPGVGSFGSLIKALASKHRFDDVFAMLDEMRSRNITPNIHVFNNCLENLAKANPTRTDEAHRLLDMMQTAKVVPNIFTLEYYLKTLARFESKAGLSTFIKGMEGRGIEPNPTVLCSAMQALTNARRPDDAKLLWHEWERLGITPNATALCSLIVAQCKTDQFESARATFNELSERGLSPNVYAFGAWIRGLARTRRLDEAIAGLHQMEKHGLAPNARVFGALIDAFAEEGWSDQVLGLIQQLQARGLSTNVYILNSLIRSQVKSDQLDSALTAFEEILDRRFPINERCLAILANGFAKQKRFEEGHAFIDRLEKLPQTGKAMLRSARCVLWVSDDQAESAYHHLMDLSDPNAATPLAYSVVLKALADTKNVDLCQTLFQKAKLSKMASLDNRIVLHWFRALMNSGQYEEAKKALAEWTEGRPILDEETCESIARVWLQFGRCDDICDWLESRPASGLAPVSAWALLIEELGKTGQITRAETWWNLFLQRRATRREETIPRLIQKAMVGAWVANERWDPIIDLIERPTIVSNTTGATRTATLDNQVATALTNCLRKHLQTHDESRFNTILSLAIERGSSHIIRSLALAVVQAPQISEALVSQAIQRLQHLLSQSAAWRGDIRRSALAPELSRLAHRVLIRAYFEGDDCGLRFSETAMNFFQALRRPDGSLRREPTIRLFREVGGLTLGEMAKLQASDMENVLFGLVRQLQDPANSSSESSTSTSLSETTNQAIQYLNDLLGGVFRAEWLPREYGQSDIFDPAKRLERLYPASHHRDVRIQLNPEKTPSPYLAWRIVEPAMRQSILSLDTLENPSITAKETHIELQIHPHFQKISIPLVKLPPASLSEMRPFAKSIVEERSRLFSARRIDRKTLTRAKPARQAPSARSQVFWASNQDWTAYLRHRLDTESAVSAQFLTAEHYRPETLRYWLVSLKSLLEQIQSALLQNQPPRPETVRQLHSAAIKLQRRLLKPFRY